MRTIIWPHFWTPNYWSNSHKTSQLEQHSLRITTGTCLCHFNTILCIFENKNKNLTHHRISSPWHPQNLDSEIQKWRRSRISNEFGMLHQVRTRTRPLCLSSKFWPPFWTQWPLWLGWNWYPRKFKVEVLSPRALESQFASRIRLWNSKKTPRFPSGLVPSTFPKLHYTPNSKLCHFWNLELNWNWNPRNSRLRFFQFGTG